MASIWTETSTARLINERKAWRKSHPTGFFARPTKNDDGSTNIYVWKAGIMGPKNTLWSGARFNVTMRFPEDYPMSPPTIRFEKGFFHPNVFPDGGLQSAMFDDEWNVAVTVKKLLESIRDQLETPDFEFTFMGNDEAVSLFKENKDEYDARIKKQTRKNYLV